MKKKDDNKQFASDLEYSKIREQKIIEFDPEFQPNNIIKEHDLNLAGAHPIERNHKSYRVEVKTDRRCCGYEDKPGTGRVSFETEYNSMPSGIFKGNFDILIYDIVGEEKLFFTDITSLQNFIKTHGFKIKLANSTVNYLIDYNFLRESIRAGKIERAGDIDWFRTFFLPEPEMTEDEFAEYALENYL